MCILFLFCKIRYLNYYYTPASTSKLWKWHRYNKFRCGNIGTCSGYRSSNEKIACRPRFEMIYSATHVISSNIASEYWVFSLRDTLALETFPCHDSSNGNTWLRGWGGDKHLETERNRASENIFLYSFFGRERHIEWTRRGICILSQHEKGFSTVSSSDHLLKNYTRDVYRETNDE